MNEKVRLPKSVCDALDYCIKENYADYEILAYAKDAQFVNNLEILNKQNPSELMRALVLGYEPIPDTPEEMMKDIWFRHSSDGYLHKRIRECIYLTLKIHEIHYDWLKDDVE